MPDAPDFDRLARTLERDVFRLNAEAGSDRAAIHLREQLRSIWNARGAVDIAKVESELSTMMGWTAAGPYVKNLDRALRALDR